MHIYISLSLYLLHICTSCSERGANVYADVHSICLTHTPAHAWCSTTPVNACRLSAKMNMDSYTYIHIYIYKCTPTHVYMHSHIYIYMDTYTYTYTYICTYTHTYVYICAYAHIYIYISISIAYAHPVASVKKMCTLMFTISV